MLAHSVQDGLSPSDHVLPPLDLEVPLSLRGKIPPGAENAFSYAPVTVSGEIREFRGQTICKPRKRAIELEEKRDLELRGVSPRWKPIASEVHLPPFGELQPAEEWVAGAGRPSSPQASLFGRSIGRGCVSSRGAAFSSRF